LQIICKAIFHRERGLSHFLKGALGVFRNNPIGVIQVVLVVLVVLGYLGFKSNSYRVLGSLLAVKKLDQGEG
jgi:hypothetical protein